MYVSPRRCVVWLLLSPGRNSEVAAAVAAAAACIRIDKRAVCASERVAKRKATISRLRVVRRNAATRWWDHTAIRVCTPVSPGWCVPSEEGLSRASVDYGSCRYSFASIPLDARTTSRCLVVACLCRDVAAWRVVPREARERETAATQRWETPI